MATSAVWTMVNNQFDSNTAANGGAIIASPGIIYWNNTVFTNNRVTASGGAIYAGSAAMIYNLAGAASNTAIFTNNSATTSGGAFYIVGASKVNLPDNTVGTFNSVSTSGGFAFISAAGSSINCGNNGNFSYNKATTTGGAFFLQSAGVAYFGSAATITYNTAGTDGGGVYATAASTVVTFNSSATISYNNAGNANLGGGVYASAAAVVNFTTYATLNNNFAGSGAAVYVTGASSAVRFSYYPQFIANNASVATSAALDARASGAVIMGSNANLQDNLPNDVYASASYAYCNPEGPAAPFLYFDTVSGTDYYNQVGSASCFMNPTFPDCSDSLYAVNFTGVVVTQIYTSGDLNAALTDAQTNAASKVLSLVPGTYTLTQVYTPASNICIQVSMPTLKEAGESMRCQVTWQIEALFPTIVSSLSFGICFFNPSYACLLSNREVTQVKF